jgi:hypothetical protein
LAPGVSRCSPRGVPARCQTPRNWPAGADFSRTRLEAPPFEVPDTSLRHLVTGTSIRERRFGERSVARSGTSLRQHRFARQVCARRSTVRKERAATPTEPSDFARRMDVIVVPRTRPLVFRRESWQRSALFGGCPRRPQSRASKKAIASSLCRDLQRPSEGAAGPAVGDLGKTTCQRRP